MQLKKQLIPNSLFLHMRSFEIAQMSQILLGGKNGERDLKSRSPTESYQWFAFCSWKKMKQESRNCRDGDGLHLGEQKELQEGNISKACYHRLPPEVGTHKD